ncbi:hypothetical protein COCNU_01G001510 [Cocos nucifera]|uniref:Uncharacterized protein n=1 Tax=Cocos nucifera TaxID=13894 RepID=A0A8K0MTQ1_COCNU|nr:hypothetical protein COCNU_01G001510 [Cocos nucifera]
MAGSGGSSSSSSSSSTRALSVDRFYNPPAVRRQLEQQKLLQQQQQQQRQRQSPPPRAAKPTARPSPVPSPPPIEVAENRAESDDSSSKPSVSSSSSSPPPRPLPPAGNLDRFLESTTPVVPAQYFPKTSLRGCKDCEESKPYFCLGDLWESFKEWSAYGAGVPLVLNGSDRVVQYYVPYLSAIQLYADPSRPSLRLRGYVGSINHHPLSNNKHHTSRLAIMVLDITPVPCSPYWYARYGCWFGVLRLGMLSILSLDLISILASTFPGLKTYKSCDLLSSSWMSVAWYPIYRIPTGPTLKDLDACFLTFHWLAAPPKDTGGVQMEVPNSCSIRNVSSSTDRYTKLQLRVFGLASYKLRGSIWMTNGLHERQLASSLLQAADQWLRIRRVDHPDYRFFISHYNTFRR